jgi:ketosteroid isomerase-like protein
MSRSIRRLAIFAILGSAALALFALTRSFASPRASRSAPPGDSAQIRAVMDSQQSAWNRGDVDAFMQGYWKSKETVFVGAQGLVRGYDSVLARYRRTYPGKDAMGHLAFSDLEVHFTCARAAFVIGQYHLQRTSGNVSGIFTLDFRRFPDGWKIVADHTTAFAPGVSGAASN